MKKVLVLAPHTDDGELGCGGSIARFIEEGDDVYYAVFSTCELSIPVGLPKNILEHEAKAAAKVLGIKDNHLFLYDYPVRTFSEHRQEILDDLVRLKNDIKPDVVYLPGENDIHQDHQVVAAEGLRAFKHASILCYEVVWNNLNTYTTAFVVLEQRQLEKKMQALEQYKSQISKHNYFSKEFVYGLATVRGVQINTRYAEAFNVLRWIQ